MTLRMSASARPAGIAQALRRLALQAIGWALPRTERTLPSRALQLQARRFNQVLSNLHGAILLVGGDKSGNWNRWYFTAIPRAERLYEEYASERTMEEEAGG